MPSETDPTGVANLYVLKSGVVLETPEPIKPLGHDGEPMLSATPAFSGAVSMGIGSGAFVAGSVHIEASEVAAHGPTGLLRVRERT